jgi:hypothetical protein
MSRMPYFISSGYYAATPDYDDAGNVRISLYPIVAFEPIYDDHESDAHRYVRPLIQGWDGTEHPEQLIKLPSGLFLDPYGRVGDEAAVLERFANCDRRVRYGRHCRYKADLLLDQD